MVKKIKVRKTKHHKAVKKAGKAEKFAAVRAKPVKICMKCGSLHINTMPAGVDRADFAGLHGGGSLKYRCETCGHVAMTFPEVDQKDIVHFRENLNKVPIEKRTACKPRPHTRLSRALFIGTGIIMCLAGIISVIIDITRGIGLGGIYLPILIALAGIAMIITGIKGNLSHYTP
ncbi:hypothetical protein KY362_01705 [Candidatus Woesearchaeota archaeon]|nr:hypothetical protein [Candidatus Woesearchaeota archaeon]